MARVFVWLTPGGGAWSLASDWDDVTDHISPSLVVPGAQDSVSVTGLSGAQLMTMTGGGLAGWAAFAGNTELLGSYAFGTLSLGAGGGGGLLQLGAGASVSASAATLASGSLLAGGGCSLAVSGALALGTAGLAGASLVATGGSDADVLALVMTNAADSIYVDPSSIVEVGGLGAGAAGLLTVDSGATLSGQGSANAFGDVANNGTLAASGGTLAVGALSGTGVLQIGQGATLALAGACGAGQTVAFAGQGVTLALNEEAFAPAGMLTGFATGDAIDVRGSAISQATYAATGSGLGVLTLFYGTQVAAQITLSGSYAGRAFLTAGDGAGGTLVTVAAQGGGGGGGGPSPGTPTPDQYVWTAPGSGSWNLAANWKDVTTGANPAAIAPGVNNLVSVTASQTGFSVITGPANAASLSLLGEVGLSGAYQIGALSVGRAQGVDFTTGALDILPGGAVAAGACTVADGAISVAGSNTALSVASTLVLGGGALLGPGLPTASLSATSGAHVQTAGLVMGGGSGAYLTTDPTGSVELGSAGGAAPGAVTIDAGRTLSGNGQVNPFGAIIDQGSILASGGTLTLGAVSGAGSLAVAAGAALELEAATSLAITLSGSAATGISTLDMAGARAAPTGTISGLVPGDTIDLEGSPLTSVQLVTSNTGGTLLLIYNTTVVARLNLSGNFIGERFLQTPDGAGGTQIVLVPAQGGGGGGGQTGTDQLAWAAPVSGAWSRAANWMDLTTGQVATQPPGPRSPVQIAGPGGTSFQSITGTGTAASLTFTGNTDLSGACATGLLTVGQLGAGNTPATAGTLALPGGTLSAGQGTLACGLLSTQSSGTQLDIAGTLTLGCDPQGAASTLLEAVGHSAMQIGGLSLGIGSNTVVVDDTSSIEIGAAGGATLGALTVDAGALAVGAGALDLAGSVIDNGVIEAQGGTLAVGAVAGAGTIGIATEASLALATTDACPIAFIGGGATLILPSSAGLRVGVITGFAAGDSIVTGAPVDSVAYVQGGGGVGTLVMTVGGVAAGQLLLAGSFAGDLFTATPDGTGAAIVLQPEGSGGPPPGTVTPDAYQWTGNAGDQAWAQPGNWTDLSQGPGPAVVAPGQNDHVSVTGGAGSALTLDGPADAASLAVSGTVSLAGRYALGTVSVNAGGVLALAAGNAVSAASGQVAGALAVGGGALAVGGTLALAATGALVASGGGTVSAQGLVLGGGGSVVATDAGSSIEIGGSSGASPGSISVDPAGVLLGAGAVGVGGQVIDQGTIAATGTLLLGAVSGGGTLLVGGGAELVLTAGAAPGLTADFTGGGTLSLAGAQAIPAIEDFGTGCDVLLSWLSYAGPGTTASYAATGPGAGLLTLEAAGQVQAQFTLLGDQSGRVFAAAAAPGGGTLLTAQPDPSAQGGTTLTTYVFSTGQISRGDLLGDVAQAFPYVSQDEFGALIGVQGIYLDYDTNGLDPAQTVFGGAGEPPGVNVEIVAPLNGVVGGGVGPGGLVTLTAGYSALLLEGNENLSITDSGLGHALLAGNYGADELVAVGDGDTLVGAPGASTTFFASLHNQNGGTTLPIDVYVHGGGNDLITTNDDNAAITTSGGHSTVVLGQSNNDVVSNGADEIVCAPYGDDTIQATAQPGTGGDTVFAPTSGLLTFIGGNTPSTVVGGGQGEMVVQGGSAGQSEVWAAGSDVNYTGGAGSAVVVAGSGFCSVQGGSGPLTVFGGTGQGVFSGGPGSIYVVGSGPTTVNAATGGQVFLVGSADVSVTGGSGSDVYGGISTGDNSFQATAGNVTLWGGAGSDQFTAGGGNDIFVSGGGDDVFNFNAGSASGVDTVVGFVAGQSIIALHGFGTQMPNLSVAWGDTIINLPGVQIIVENVTNLTAANFKLT